MFRQSAFRKRFTGWMGKTSGFLSGMAKNAFSAVKSKLPSLKTLLMTGGLAALLYFLKSPYFEKVKAFIQKELIPILANLWDNYIKPFGIFLKDKVVKFFTDLGGFVKDPSWTTAGTLITENKGLLATLGLWLAVKTFGVGGLLTGVKSVAGLLTKGWGPKAVAAATKAMKGLTLGKGLAMGGLVAAVGLAINDAIMAVAKADEWKVSKTSAGIGGFLGGTGSGWSGAFENAGKWATAGASAGFLIGGPIGALIGGLGGGVVGAILGFFGGEKIAKVIDGMGIWFKEKWDAIVGVFKTIVTDVTAWIKLLFKDPVAAMKKLWDKLTEGYADLMAIIWKPVKDGIAWIMRLFGWDEAAAATEKFSIKTFIMGRFATIKKWFTGLFKWGKKAGATEEGGWSLKKMVSEGVAKVWASIKTLFSNLFNIDWKSVLLSVVPKAVRESKIGKLLGLGSPATAAQLAKDLAGAQGKLGLMQTALGKTEKSIELGGRGAQGAGTRRDQQKREIDALQKEIQDIKAKQAAAGGAVAVNAPNTVDASKKVTITHVSTDMKGLSSAAQVGLSSAW